jgi:hypothetical protein
MLQGYKKLEGLEPESEESKVMRVRREMKALRAGVRGQNKVSVLAKDLADKFKGQQSVAVADTKKTVCILCLCLISNAIQLVHSQMCFSFIIHTQDEY